MHVITENEARNLAQRIDQGGTFVVPPNTVLTPMARDYLRGRGIELSGNVAPVSAPIARSEAVTEKVLNAITDTQVSVAGEASETAVQRVVVWGIGGDRPGILADVADLLKKWKINILEISQTVLSGVFAMVVIVDVGQAMSQFAEFKAELEALGKSLGVNLSAQRDDLFQYMHRV